MRLNFKKNKKIKRKSDFLEAEEILFNKEALSKLSDLEEVQRLELDIGRWGLDLLLIFFVLFLVFALSWVFVLNISKGKELKLAAQQNAMTSIPIIANRGLIFDKFNKELVYNQEVFDLVLFPVYLPVDKTERTEILEKIRQDKDIAASLAEEKLEENKNLEPIVLKADLTREEAIKYESYFANIPAIQVMKQNLRQYTNSFAFSHVLGYTGRLSKEDIQQKIYYPSFMKIGKSGLEAFYEDYLKGENGEIRILRNAVMEILNQGVVKEPVDGNNLYLTIDADLQEYSYNRLAKQIKSLGTKPRGGVVIVTNPNSGEILSLVSYPGYDTNLFSKGISIEEFQKLVNDSSKPLFNRAILGMYNPGSTIKPIMATAALAEKIIDPYQKIETHGYITIPNPYFPDKPSIFVDWRNNGYVNMIDAIARSSNVYFYIIGGGYQQYQGLGIEKIKKYLEEFQFNSITGIDLPSEKIGYIPDEKSKNPWRIGDTYNVSIGQGDLTVTPIRLITSLNSLINGGRLLRPYLVDHISANNNQIVLQNNPQVIKDNFLNPDDLKIVKEGMGQTVKSVMGTAQLLADLPFSVGGKSGSAQTTGNTKINALFYGFAPFENPKISILVLIEDVPEGSLNAIPVVKDILLWYYKNRGF